ncbi:hypothetical protein OF83DRAFT_1294179 [Amylostereum chailletii]|nr:hypothetical protein OF83DRAFT_1294179 [Amylostereum chailletii]
MPSGKPRNAKRKSTRFPEQDSPMADYAEAATPPLLLLDEDQPVASFSQHADVELLDMADWMGEAVAYEQESEQAVAEPDNARMDAPALAEQVDAPSPVRIPTPSRPHKRAKNASRSAPMSRPSALAATNPNFDFGADRGGLLDSADAAADDDSHATDTPPNYFPTPPADTSPYVHSPILSRLSRRFDDVERVGAVGGSERQQEESGGYGEVQRAGMQVESRSSSASTPNTDPSGHPRPSSAARSSSRRAKPPRNIQTELPLHPPSPPEEYAERVGALGVTRPVENLSAFERAGSPSLRHDFQQPEVQETSPQSDLSGHVRSPILAKQPTRFENISRTMHNYVPSSISIAIPSAALSPPRVSRPLSFGKFMTPAGNEVAADAAIDRRRSWGAEAGSKTLDEVLSLEHETALSPGLVRYPSSDASERITWARWDVLHPVGGGKPRRLLLLGYLSGMQIWDCDNLDSTMELLNLPDAPWGRVWSAAVLPTPPLHSDDRFRPARPLIGVVAKCGHRDPEFIAYSLSTHTVVQRRSILGLVSFSSNANFTILSTSRPAALIIVSSCTLETLFVIPSASLLTFSCRATTHNTNTNVNNNNISNNINNNNANMNDTNVLLTDNIDPEQPPPDTQPHPVFALSHRLLAYTSPAPRADRAGQPPPPVQGALNTSLAQADLSGVALRMGSSVLSGMRSLGGLAMTAARSRMAGGQPPLARPFASRSAPTEIPSPTTDTGRAVVDIGDVPTSPRSPVGTTATTATTTASAEASRGHHVTVLDLAPLLEGGLQPEPIVAFAPSKHQRVSALRFSEDGTHVVVVPEDGQTLRTFVIRPASRAMRRLQGAEADAEEDEPKSQGTQWHLYDLRRGRTKEKTTEHNLSVPSAVPGIGGTSISLPTRTSFGRLSASPPSGATRVASSGLSQMLERPVELVGRESEVATWNLKRGRDWDAVRRSVKGGEKAERKPRGKANWLAHAELQTSSASPRVLPRPIYLSHQFAFHTLGEDYHGLLRRYRLDVAGAPIEVRRAVAVSAYPDADVDAFAQDEMGMGMGGASASFDGPLSSAMASALAYPASPPVIPMYPNGPARPGGSFKNSIPIQRISGGMSESFGRLRREMGRVRSPRVRAGMGTGAGVGVGEGARVPLEFDEEDEDFRLEDYEEGGGVGGVGGGGDEETQSGGGSAPSVSTPSTTDVLEHAQREQGKDGGEGGAVEAEGAWIGWEDEDRRAVEEEERFQDISVVGFMDEEQEERERERRERRDAVGGGGGKKRKGGGRGKKGV